MPATDSLTAQRPHVLVTQLGGELECALSRGWIDALREVAEVETVARLAYAQIIDAQYDPAAFHGHNGSPLELLRLLRSLKARRFDHALCLDGTLAGRLLATVCDSERRIQTRIGPPRLPSDIDALLGVLFGRLGIDAPVRQGPLTFSARTVDAAGRILDDLGYRGQRPAMIAPRANGGGTLERCWRKAQSIVGDRTILPVVLLPPGEELELISVLGGKAYFVNAPELPLRAALIGRAAALIGDHEASVELAGLMHTPAIDRPAGPTAG